MKSCNLWKLRLRCSKPGASKETLIKRTKYGGRKGRRAVHRLLGTFLTILF